MTVTAGALLAYSPALLCAGCLFGMAGWMLAGIARQLLPQRMRIWLAARRAMRGFRHEAARELAPRPARQPPSV